MRGWVAWAYLRHIPGTAIVVFLLGLTLSFLVTATATVRDTAELAVEDSLRADLGGRAYAVQSGDPAVAEALRSVHDAGLVVDDLGAVTTPDLRLRVAATVRVIQDPRLHLGVLVSGGWPKGAGDAVVSEALADALGLDVGERAFLASSRGPTEITITGLTVDPADISSRTVTSLVTSNAALVGTRWLLNDPFAVAELQQPLTERRATVQSTAGLVEAASRARPAFVTALTHVPLGVAASVGALMAAFAAMRSRRWTLDVDILMSAGMTQRGAWRTVLDGCALTLLAGLVAGIGAALAMLAVFRVIVSSWFNQRWVRLDIPWRLIVIVLLTAALAVLVQRHSPRKLWVRAVATARRIAVSASIRGRVAWTVLVVSLAAWGALTAAAASQAAEDLLGLLPVLAAVSIAAVPFAVGPFMGARLGPALRALCQHVAAGMSVVVAVATTVALLCGVWAGLLYAGADVGERASSPLQPAGSFVVDRVPDRVIPALQRAYQDAGGRDFLSWQRPDESRANLRVTSVSLVDCLDREDATRLNSLAESCWPQNAASPVSPVVLGPPGSRDIADPDLLVDGRIGLLLFEGEGQVTRSSRAAAASDVTLGGIIPGLVVAEGGPVAREYGLQPNGLSAVVLRDFSRLDEQNRLRVRAEVARFAPGAMTADGTDPTTYDRLRSTAVLAAVLGAVLASVLLALGLWAAATAQASTRRLLVDVGGVVRIRFGLVARWLLLPVAGATTTMIVTMITVTSGLRQPIPGGALIWLPGGALLAVTAVAAPAFLRVPTADDE